MATKTAFRARQGDEIVIRGHTVGAREATGEILEVFGEPGHERYRVRWDDGHESIHYPAPTRTSRRRQGRANPTRSVTPARHPKEARRQAHTPHQRRALAQLDVGAACRDRRRSSGECGDDILPAGHPRRAHRSSVMGGAERPICACDGGGRLSAGRSSTSAPAPSSPAPVRGLPPQPRTSHRRGHRGLTKEDAAWPSAHGRPMRICSAAHATCSRRAGGAPAQPPTSSPVITAHK